MRVHTPFIEPLPPLQPCAAAEWWGRRAKWHLEEMALCLKQQRPNMAQMYAEAARAAAIYAATAARVCGPSEQ